ncbi:hypothetical protein MLD38_006303 [Melastoma candidum]|uniref:Uncharacterized protein n=1 Tax=Melastoma candidum TaxID=119954 RepID=A0ACB9RMZ5_9MYRT|nr:hypothetical protein MLD38_006303 [Melastoma candidum]
MKKGDEWKTASKTNLATVDPVLRTFIGKFVVVYFDDILIYSCNPDEHIEHLRIVFHTLRDEKLYGNLKKPIKQWQGPRNFHDVRIFHGLASFYKRFIRGFCSIAAPLTECLKGDKFEWTSTAQASFERLKECRSEAPVLTLPDLVRMFDVKCNASGVGIGEVLMQEGRPIAYFSEKLNGVKLNYST